MLRYSSRQKINEFLQVASGYCNKESKLCIELLIKVAQLYNH